MTSPMPGHDTLSLGMFLAGALMVFTPLIAAAAVLVVWWRQRARERGKHDGERHPARPGP